MQVDLNASDGVFPFRSAHQEGNVLEQRPQLWRVVARSGACIRSKVGLLNLHAYSKHLSTLSCANIKSGMEETEHVVVMVVGAFAMR